MGGGGGRSGLICVLPLAGRKCAQGEWGQCACERQLARHVPLDLRQIGVRPREVGVGPGGEWHPKWSSCLCSSQTHITLLSV